MTEAEEKQRRAIYKALPGNKLLGKILIDHEHDLPRAGNCILTLEESLALGEWTDAESRARRAKNIE